MKGNAISNNIRSVAQNIKIKTCTGWISLKEVLDNILLASTPCIRLVNGDKTNPTTWKVTKSCASPDDGWKF